MPFYNAKKIKKAKLRDVHNPEGNSGEYQPLAGEFMKAGVVTYRKNTGSKPHWHENEEQYIYLLEGRRFMRLGDEERIVGPGDIMHIPRGTLHGGRTLNDKAVMFVVKSPATEKDLGSDHHYPNNLEEMTSEIEEKASRFY